MAAGNHARRWSGGAAHVLTLLPSFVVASQYVRCCIHCADSKSMFHCFVFIQDEAPSLPCSQWLLGCFPLNSVLPCHRIHVVIHGRLFCIGTSTNCFQVHWVFKSLPDVSQHNFSRQVACINSVKLDRTCAVDSIMLCKYIIQV